MAEFAFTLDAAPTLGGHDRTIGGNSIAERHDLALVSIACPLGGDAALAAALQSGWGLSAPTSTVASTSGDTHLLQTAPDQMLFLFPHSAPDAERVVQAKLNGSGYTTDQTDSWVVLEVSGPETLAALERLCPLDAATMPEGGFGRTTMEHMGALILRLSSDRFLLLSASSSANSFLHAVETSFEYVLTDE